ncbi:PGC-1 and ERR-induced regulator in muscle protein 1 [Mugil cephalus]|uniref:PGC-1 and ERR-induced regulator in muscle protein 1 n=1 Tax=Mugil cephalus TaxID=48193 RepID=UPI001FB73539|nr:PGC-1 and ERR-induced regulator in muscle protein 1 [Mugil cephalus]XP_047465393.1 PGC-1 and ERR-induced regulator in muscle protein 1 [Mugil cephalus]
MEDFEYSVEISDRDWQCFFAECEECNILPPSLAGLDDSGMSDIDDAGSILAKKAQREDPTAGLSVAERPIDGPPDCEGTPVEHYLSEHGIGGMENVLSGSEEDIHLQTVNMFFERLKSLTEAEPSQGRLGKSSKEEQCNDGQQASGSVSPKNIPKSNSLPDTAEKTAGQQNVRPVDTTRNLNTMKKFHSFPEPTAAVLSTNKPAVIELFIREEGSTETRINEATQQNHSHDSAVRVSAGTTPHDNSVETRTTPDDNKLGGVLTSQFILTKDVISNPEVVTNVSGRDEHPTHLLRLDATSTNKARSQESSPSASVKRKRRKKRRLSMEPGESGHGYERPISDSEEERYSLRGASFDDINSFYPSEPQQNFTPPLSPFSTSSNFPLNVSDKDMKVNHLFSSALSRDGKYQNLPECVVRQKKYMGSENTLTNSRSVTPMGHTDVNEDRSDNVETSVQPPCKIQVEESAGLKEYPDKCSLTECVTVKSDLTREIQRQDIKSDCLEQSDQINHSDIGCESEKCRAAEVKSITHSVLQESNAPAVEVGQNDRLSTAKSVLAEEAGNSGRDERTLRQNEAEPRQQLETECHSAGQYSSTLEITQFPPSATPGIACDAINTKPKRFKPTVGPFLDEVSNEVAQPSLTSIDCINSSSDKSHLLKSLYSSEINHTAEQNERPAEVQTSSELEISSSEIDTNAERDELEASTETKSSLSDLLTSHSDITHVSSCCTLDTESVTSLSNGNFTDMSTSFCSSVSEQETGGKGESKEIIVAKQKDETDSQGGDSTSGPRSHPESKCDLLAGAEEAVTTSKAEPKPEKALNSVFAMSSFWNEMEKLTINDILGLRMSSKTPPPCSLPPLQEREEADTTDSSGLTQINESKPEPIGKDSSSSVPDPGGSSLDSVIAVNPSSSRGVMWESEPVPDIYPENMMLTSVTDASQPVLSETTQTRLRKISKNVSVRNLHALDSESFGHARKCEALQALDEGDSEKVEYFDEGSVPRQDKGVDSSSLYDSYRISLSDIFQYLFGGKQSVPSPPPTDNTTPVYIDGTSVPETYEHFFSEFDTESFFYPLTTSDDKDKDKRIPIFSCSRAANRNLQYPEAYDYFFASSSSDDSSPESDDEDSHGPVRVVTRFTRKASSTHISGDIYENFFTDSDLRQDLFWKTTFSFRNINLTASTVQREGSDSLSLVSVRQSSTYHQRRVPLNALGNQDVMLPDPLLYYLEERISKQLAQQPFRYEDLQTIVSNPRLDASFLPLRQSDMCLVCIAFASWVLKTANPQVGDAWKAVLLANVSALSAIRYLRRYVKVEAVASETKLRQLALCDS